MDIIDTHTVIESVGNEKKNDIGSPRIRAVLEDSGDIWEMSYLYHDPLSVSAGGRM